VRATAVLAVALGTSVVTAQSGAAQPVNSRSVTVAITDVSPSTPAVSTTPTPLSVTLTLTNNTDQTLTDLQIVGVRSNPLTTRTELQAAIAHPQPPDPDLAAPMTTPKPVS